MKTIEDLIKRRNKLEKELAKIKKAIEAFQEVCEHDYVSDGYTDGGGKRYKTCKICENSDWD